MPSDQPISFADPEVVECPFGAYRQLQETTPVYFDTTTGLYEIVGAAEIKAAANDTTIFSNLLDRQGHHDIALQARIADLYRTEGFPPEPTLLNNDGEAHRKLRSLVDRAFTVPRINALLPMIRDETEALISACDTSGEIEFIGQFAIPLPLNIIADQLGVSREDHHTFKAGSDAMIAVADPLTKPDEMLRFVNDIIAMQQIIARRVEHVRADPDDTILSVVANAEIDGSPLSVGLMVNLFQNILVAGNETTTNALGSMLEELIADRALAQRLRADSAAIRPFVEEVLRLRAPLQGFFRSVTRDTELGGVAIPRGASVMLRWGAGGRDPSAFPIPETLDIERRSVTQHMTFGHGVHFCIGNQLARAEMRVACEAILTHWPNVRLAGDHAIVRQMLFFAHGAKSMKIRVD